ncbi:MAG: hypothetical protein AB8G05_27570 [Oligoflexales bacterium]
MSNKSIIRMFLFTLPLIIAAAYFLFDYLYYFWYIMPILILANTLLNYTKATKYTVLNQINSMLGSFFALLAIMYFLDKHNMELFCLGMEAFTVIREYISNFLNKEQVGKKENVRYKQDKQGKIYRCS